MGGVLRLVLGLSREAPLVVPVVLHRPWPDVERCEHSKSEGWQLEVGCKGESGPLEDLAQKVRPADELEHATLRKRAR